MKRNMKQWVADTIAAPAKQAVPVLSFPAVQLMDITVRDLISSSEYQAKGMKMIADRVDTAAAVSLMDLSVEAEAFGSTVRFSDDGEPGGTAVSEQIRNVILDGKNVDMTDECEANGNLLPDEKRLTKVGKFVRSTSLDELPQLWNILKGDMKLVGVRPLSKTKFDTYPEWLQDLRTKAKPGLVPPFYVDMPQTQEEMFDSEARYLRAYLEHPIRTDWSYFWRAFYQIVFKHARSK